MTYSQKIQMWSSQLSDSSIGRFLRWWVAELRSMLPTSWRERLAAESRPLQIFPVADGFLLQTDSHNNISIATGSDHELAQQQIQQLLQASELENPEKVLYLGADEVLQTEVSLPLAAESRLRQALEFDLDRQTPFQAADVYFDYRVLLRDKDHNVIRLQLYLVPRAQVDQLLLSLHQLGIDPNRMVLADDPHGSAEDLNLLPPEKRAIRINHKSRFNRLLILVVLILLFMLMFQSIRVREQYIEELEAAIETVSTEARMVAAMRTQLEDAREGSNFLAMRETMYPEDIQVIAELTRILKDDTWVQRLIIKDGEIRVQGLSQEAQRLIRDINTSPLFSEAAFLGTTQFDSRAQRERFNLSAKLMKTADIEAVEDIETIAEPPEAAAEGANDTVVDDSGKEAENATTTN